MIETDLHAAVLERYFMLMRREELKLVVCVRSVNFDVLLGQLVPRTDEEEHRIIHAAYYSTSCAVNKDTRHRGVKWKSTRIKNSPNRDVESER
jgi:hypothetical protein